MASPERYYRLDDARENLFPDGSFETRAHGVLAQTRCTVTRSSDQAYRGTHSLKIVAAGGGDVALTMTGLRPFDAPLGAGTPVSIGVRVFADAASAGNTVAVQFQGITTHGTTINMTQDPSPLTLVAGWNDYGWTEALPIGQVTEIRWIVRIIGAQATDTAYLDELVVAFDDALPTYYDGDDTGWLWLEPDGTIGTPNDSPSVHADDVRLLLEPSATNWVTNPHSGNAGSTAGWSTTNASIASTNLARYRVKGERSLLVTASGANATATITITADDGPAVATADLINLSASPRTYKFVYNGSDIGDPHTLDPGGHAALSAPFTGTGATASLSVVCTDSANTEQFVMRWVQAEPGTEPTSYSPCVAYTNTAPIRDGWAWAGTAHQSVSTREAAVLHIPHGGAWASVSAMVRHDSDKQAYAYRAGAGALADGAITVGDDGTDVTLDPQVSVVVGPVRVDRVMLGSAEKTRLAGLDEWTVRSLTSTALLLEYTSTLADVEARLAALEGDA